MNLLRQDARRFSSEVASSRLTLRGNMVALTTPFDSDQRIAFDKLKHNLQMYEKIPLTGYLVAGTNGEAPFLTPDERIQVVKFVRENTDQSKMVIGGATAESTRLCSEMASEMAKAGADGVLVMPPFYFKSRLTEEAIVNHFTSVAETADIPLVVYNNPGVTGIDISTPALTKLAHHPLIRGVKDGDVRKIAATVQATKDLNFDVVCSSAGYLLPALMNGCSGGMTGLATILGQAMCDLYTAYKENQFKTAMEIQARLINPDIEVLAQYGPAGLKSAMDLLGYYGGDCRRPMLPIAEASKQSIYQSLKRSQYL